MDKQFPLQQCQDEKITKSFRKLHTDIVNMIIKWCKDNNVIIDEFHLNGDGADGSIPYGEWKACTDSGLTFYKFTDEYKDAILMKKILSTYDFNMLKLKQEPYLFSM